MQVLAPPVAKHIQVRHVYGAGGACGDYIYAGPKNKDVVLEVITDHEKSCPKAKQPVEVPE